MTRGHFYYKARAACKICNNYLLLTYTGNDKIENILLNENTKREIQCKKLTG